MSTFPLTLGWTLKAHPLSQPQLKAPQLCHHCLCVNIGFLTVLKALRRQATLIRTFFSLPTRFLFIAKQKVRPGWLVRRLLWWAASWAGSSVPAWTPDFWGGPAQWQKQVRGSPRTVGSSWGEHWGNFKNMAVCSPPAPPHSRGLEFNWPKVGPALIYFRKLPRWFWWLHYQALLLLSPSPFGMHAFRHFSVLFPGRKSS